MREGEREGEREGGRDGGREGEREGERVKVSRHDDDIGRLTVKSFFSILCSCVWWRHR